MKKENLIMWLMLILSGLFLKSSAIGNSEIHGKVTDRTTNEAVEFANVIAMQNDKVISATTTDENGYYTIKPIKEGTYTVKAVKLGFNDYIIKEVVVNADKMTYLDIHLLASIKTLPDVEVYTYANPLIDKSNVSSMHILETKEIQHSPYNTVLEMVANVPGATQMRENGEINFRGSRSGGTQYLVDGMKVYGPVNLPKSSIKEIKVLTGGIPASIGDATGGVVMITTKDYYTR